MLQAELTLPRMFTLTKDAPVPIPDPSEVLVKVQQVGICGSDLHAYHGKHPFISCPVVPGHEFVGTVEQCGDGTQELVGQRVTALPSLTCGQCPQCREGRFNICQTLRVIGCQAPGAFAEYVLVPKNRIFPLPDALDWDLGTLVEPLAVAVHAVRRARRISGANTLVLGCGTIGLMTLYVLKNYGAGSITAVDLQDSRLELAGKLGADKLQKPDEAIAAPIHTSFECVGIEATMNQAILATEKGGEIGVLGVFEEDAPVKMGLVQDKELTLLGTLMYTDSDYEEAIRLLSTNPSCMKELITHRYSLSDVDNAFQHLNRAPQETMKVVLTIE